MHYSPGAATYLSIKRRQRVVNCLRSSTIVLRDFLPAGSRGVVHRMVTDVFLQYSVVEPSDSRFSSTRTKKMSLHVKQCPLHKTSMQKKSSKFVRAVRTSMPEELRAVNKPRFDIRQGSAWVGPSCDEENAFRGRQSILQSLPSARGVLSKPEHAAPITEIQADGFIAHLCISRRGDHEGHGGHFRGNGPGFVGRYLDWPSAMLCRLMWGLGLAARQSRGRPVRIRLEYSLKFRGGGGAVWRGRMPLNSL